MKKIYRTQKIYGKTEAIFIQSKQKTRHLLRCRGFYFFSLEKPVIYTGIKDMKVLKTTQSGFEGFLRDRFTTLQEAKDRVFCTSVYARWRYNQYHGINFDMAW